MSLASFQRALCELIASPSLCLQLRADPDGTLSRYDLTVRERSRLSQAVWQRGMSTNCTLYRSNRVTPIYTLLRYTCQSLGAQFGRLLNQFWAVRDYKDGQFRSEVERFGAFLRERIAAGAVTRPFAGEMLDFELARNALEFGPRQDVLPVTAELSPGEPWQLHPLARLVRFRHDPELLLGAAASGTMPAPDLPLFDAVVVLSVASGSLTVMQLAAGAPSDGDAGAALARSPAARRELADAGLLVPSASVAHGSACSESDRPDVGETFTSNPSIDRAV